MKQRVIDFLMGKQPQTAEVNPTSTYGADIDNFINALKEQPYMQKLYNAPMQERLSDEQIAEKVANGLNLGIPELAQAQKDVGIRIPQGTEQIAQAQLGEFNKPMVVAGVNNAPREGGLIQGYKQGYNLNYDNPTNTVGTRIGQALGSVGRLVDSPLGRGLIAYGLSNAMGDDNPLEQALTAGVGRYNAQTADRVYRNQLRNLGMNEQELGNIRGNITDDIFKNYTLANYRNNMTNYRNLKLDKDTYIKQQQNIYKMLNDGVITAEEATKQMQLLNDEYQKQNPMDMQEGNKTVQGNRRLDIMQQNADTYAKKADKVKVEDTDEYKQDYTDYIRIMTDPKLARYRSQAQVDFAAKYGKNPKVN